MTISLSSSWAIPLVIAASLLALPFLLPSVSWERDIQVAFLGNSVQFTNDLPRLMEALSNHASIQQNSCFNAYATIANMWYGGNGMYGKYTTPNALIANTIESSKYIYDYGACTTLQLLQGTDERLAQGNDGDFDDNNPCAQDENYLYYALHHYGSQVPKWDFVVINDATRHAARKNTRQAALKALRKYYAPWFNSTAHTIPVLISTHAYWTESRDMGGLEDVPTFTSLTHEGYRQYAAVLNAHLPKEQKTRIAPVGIAFLLVWEDNYGMWQSLFQPNNFYLSPHGTYLMACVVYYTLYQHMPPPLYALPESISTLFQRARRMQPPIHHDMPVPTRQEAAYLYHIAERVMALGHLPRSFVKYTNGEASDYRENTNQDTSYYEEEEEYYFDYQDFEGDDYV